MPIRPEHRWLYPIDWPEISRIVRFTRAAGRCEHCRRPHGRHVAQLVDAAGVWWDPEIRTTAHLNHDPTYSGPRWRNLAALCQRCHMIHDAAEHRRRRWWNAFRQRALGDLFSGRYS
jgi:hypothetical protein